VNIGGGAAEAVGCNEGLGVGEVLASIWLTACTRGLKWSQGSETTPFEPRSRALLTEVASELKMALD
jgi:hypothetical protein